MLPPSHRYTHEFCWISSRDTAWDVPRIEAEIAAINAGTSKEWTSVDQHPMRRYWAGETRCDLAQVKHYLRPDELPTIFRLRRLTLSQWSNVIHLQERNLMAQSRIELVRFGLAAIDNAPHVVNLTGGALDDADIMAVRELLGDARFVTLAGTIAACNRELGPDELFL